MSTFLVSQLFRCSLHFDEIDGENFRNFQKICFDEVFDSRLIFDEERTVSPCFLLIKRNFIYSIKINLIPWLDRKVRTSANFYSDTKKSVSQKRVITLRSFISLLVRKSFEIVFFFFRRINLTIFEREAPVSKIRVITWQIRIEICIEHLSTFIPQ